MTATKEQSELAAFATKKVGRIYDAVQEAINAVDTAGEFSVVDRPLLIDLIRVCDPANFDDLPEWAVLQ